MNYFDIIIAIPLLWGAYKGFSKGLVSSIASLIALLLGIYGAIQFSDFIAVYVSGTVDVEANYIPLIAFAITFIGIVIGIHFLAKILTKLVDAIALSWLNTLAGTLFGILKMAFILSVFIFIFEKIDTKENILSPELKENSLLYEPVQFIAPAIFPALNEVNLNPHMPNAVLPKLPI